MNFPNNFNQNYEYNQPNFQNFGYNITNFNNNNQIQQQNIFNNSNNTNNNIEKDIEDNKYLISRQLKKISDEEFNDYISSSFEVKDLKILKEKIE